MKRRVRRPNGRAFSGEPSEQSERPERRRGRRVRCNAMLGLGTCTLEQRRPALFEPSDKDEERDGSAPDPFDYAEQRHSPPRQCLNPRPEWLTFENMTDASD